MNYKEFYYLCAGFLELILSRCYFLQCCSLNIVSHLNERNMYLTSEVKKEIFEKHGKNVADTGSAEGQVALFTYRITHLTEHLKKNKKDFSTQRALVSLVGKRRRLLDYLVKNDIERYRSIIKELGLRR
jgi:small subunit ribosomal protein S15